MAERRLREKLLYFALVPAIAVAVFVLGGLALQTNLRIEQARQRTMFEVTETLVLERINVLDENLIRQDNAVASYTNVPDVTAIGKRWAAAAPRETPTVRGIVVLDMAHGSHDVLAFASRAPSVDDDVFRRLLLTKLLKTMTLGGPPEELHHLHEVVDDRQVLLGYFQRTIDGRRVLVVVWHDVDKIVSDVMPQLFRDADRGNARMNVVDERGRIVFGSPIKVGELTVGKPVLPTLYNWRLQVALTSAEDVDKQVNRRRFIELSMVVVAGLVTVAGLIILINASLKERRLSALKSDFVANVSHELKTPLSLIRMFGELLLLERVASDEKRKQYLSIIVGESERLTALIENVLDFAKVERGKAAYDFADGHVEEVVQRAIDIYRFRSEREKVTVTLDLPPDLPTTRIDVRALELAVMNLVDNAIKYAKEGGRVHVSVAASEGTISIDVADFGPGIPKKEQARIFERFFRGSSADSTRARGSGIGLSLVRHIAESHGGRVRVKSPTQPDGTGTTFSIELPLTRESGRRSLLPRRSELPPPPARTEPKSTDQGAGDQAPAEGPAPGGDESA